MRLSILDDYQGVALDMADWSPVRGRGVDIAVERHAFADEDAVVRAFADSELVAAMRERTPFPKSLVDRLPKLKLLITTGMRNASFDMAALKDRGVVVCGTGGPGGGNGNRRTRLGPDPRRRPAHRRGSSVYAPGRMADPYRPPRRRQDAGPAGSRPPRQRRRPRRARFRNEGNRLEPEPDRGEGCGAGRRTVEKDELFRRSDILSVHLVLSPRSRGIAGPERSG